MTASCTWTCPCFGISFFSNYIDSGVGLKHSCQVRLLIHIHSPGPADIQHLSQAPHRSHQRHYHLTRDCLSMYSHCEHQGNETINKTPHSNGKLMALWERRKAVKLVIVQGTKRLALLAIYFFTCYCLHWEEGAWQVIID